MPPAPKRSPGERLGPFAIERHLASGGMGDVYVARDVERGGTVALKLLALETGPAVLERFEREGRIASTLEHPHIVAGRGSGRAEDGTPYLALELLQGVDLETRLRQGGVTPAMILAIAIQVLDALEYAHARGVVHRDLKPQNVFLCDGPELNVKVLDFGIARLAAERRMTATGSVIGTFSYMSPEQSRGDRDVDARTDIWSLGVMLFECLTGTMPFDGDTGPATLFKILFEPPPDLGKLVPGVPTDLVAVIARALRKSRDDRFSNAAAMRSSLASIEPASLAFRAVAAGQGIGEDATASYTSVADASLDAERRLTSVTYLRDVRDVDAVERAALELQGRVVVIAGDALVAFGIDRWSGDEPVRAVRLALSAATMSAGAGVATGRVLRGASAVAGAAVTIANHLASHGGVRIDATTAGIVRDAFVLGPNEGATGTLVLEASRSGARSTPPPATPFVGRDVEVQLLLGVATRAVEEFRARGALVVGPSGIGKSRLRREAMTSLRAQRDDMAIVVTRCDAYRRDTSWAALREAFDSWLSPADLAKAFDDPGTHADPVAAMDRTRSIVLAAVEAKCAAGGVLLVVEDAQWLDPASRSTIRWLCENAVDHPIAVWLFTRPDGVDSVRDVVTGSTVIDLGPLSRAASEELLRHIAGDAPEAVLERAGGHPLFLEELGRLFVDRGARAMTGETPLPISIEAVLLSQLDQLEATDREFVKRAAIFGPVFWQEGVASLGGDVASIMRLRRANLVTPRAKSRFEGTREFAFRTGLLPEVASSLWPEPVRAKLHGDVAAWLSARGTAAPDELARHLDLAGDVSRAADAYARAAEASANSGDVEGTFAKVERVLALTTDPHVRFRARAAYDHVAVVAANDLRGPGLDEMTALAAQLGPAERIEAARRRCNFARLRGHRDEALRAGHDAVTMAAEQNDKRAGSIAARELAMLFATEHEFVEARTHASRAQSLAVELGDPSVIGLALFTRAFIEGEARASRESLELHRQSVEYFRQAGDRRRETQARVNISDQLMHLGRLDEAADELDRAIAASLSLGNVRATGVSTHNFGVVRRLQGDLADARAKQEKAIRMGEQSGHARLVANSALEVGYIAMAEGSPETNALVARARHAAAQTRNAGVIARARALELRAKVIDRAAVPEARREIAQSLTAQSDATVRCELAAALWASDPADEPATKALREALDALTAAVPAEDRARCHDAWVKRLLLPGDAFPLSGRED